MWVHRITNANDVTASLLVRCMNHHCAQLAALHLALCGIGEQWVQPWMTNLDLPRLRDLRLRFEGPPIGALPRLKHTRGLQTLHLILNPRGPSTTNHFMHWNKSEWTSLRKCCITVPSCQALLHACALVFSARSSLVTVTLRNTGGSVPHPMHGPVLAQAMALPLCVRLIRK